MTVKELKDKLTEICNMGYGDSKVMYAHYYEILDDFLETPIKSISLEKGNIILNKGV